MGNVTKVRAKSGNANGRTIRLPRASVGSQLSIGTLSWNRLDHPHLALPALLKSLTDAQIPNDTDLTICAGFTLARAAKPSTILNASGGSPVLYEVGSEWRVASYANGKARSTQLRDRQLLGRFDDDAGSRKLARLLSKGGGVLFFPGVATRLVLFICGENNILTYTRRGSVIKAGDKLSFPDLSHDWIGLNPAHFPYKKPVAATGFGKVAETASGQGPTLGKLVQKRDPRKNGTVPPRAVVHCNNLDKSIPITVNNNSVVYSKPVKNLKRPLQPKQSRSGTAGNIDWYFRLYSLPIIQT